MQNNHIQFISRLSQIKRISFSSLHRYVKITLLAFLTMTIIACESDKITEENKTDNNLSPIQIQSAQSISLNNQGVGEMGSFDYVKASVSFEKLVAENPKWSLAKQNLAIALLNRQKPGDEERAMQIAIDLSTADDANLVAHYIVGILKFNQGLCEEALPRFEKVINGDNQDAYAYYFTGQCHLQNGEVEKALELYQKALKADSYLRSAYYGGFMAAQRLQKAGLAKQMLGDYQKMASNPKARLAEIKYTRMGPKASALSSTTKKITGKFNAKAPFFKSPKVLAFTGVEKFGVVNLEQSEESQLYVVSANELKIFDAFLSNPIERSGLSIKLLDGAHQLAWGDINNDNKIDVYVTGKIDQLYIQDDKNFKAVDMSAFGLANLTSKAVRLSDADHDGDLDVLLLSDSGKFEIWNNNLNNTFTALSSKTYLPPETGYSKIFIQDIDSDRDVDIVLQSNEKFVTLLNDRMWDYEVLYSLKNKTGIKSLTFADNNTNGMPEINVLFADGVIKIFEFDRLTQYFSETSKHEKMTAQAMLQLDVNGNGQKEFLLADQESIKIHTNSGEVQEQIMLSQVGEIKVLNTAKGAELLILKNSNIIHVPASKSRAPFLWFGLSGKTDDANSVRSNYSGIGTEFTLRNENFYALGDSYHNLSGVDQDYQSMNIAAGFKKNTDYIALEWSDGVYQTELELPSNQYHKITETQRQLSSCPVIFAWNNDQYEFVSDVLGVGGIGFAIGRHEYGTPRPWENYLLKSEQLSSKEGFFKLQFTEPMEESAYLDNFQIQVVDVPQPYQMILDERMGISDPVVTGEPLFYRDKIMPNKVTNALGENVTQAVRETDKMAIEIINSDNRFLGLVDEQITTMEFNHDLIGDYQFIMNGWVEYGYSQTMFAAWQAGKVAQAPTLEYLVDGQWKILLKEFGYPAGMPRASSVALTIPNKTQALRIRTNMEIYFDELALVKTHQVNEVEKHQLTLYSAQLKQLGFPKREDNSQLVPSYDMNNIKPFWDTRYMEGAYTQLGEIKPLLEKQDNALAIIGAGEAIELSFVDDVPDLKEGYQRYYLLKFIGWAKDMDILTKAGETLEPIPANGIVSEQAKRLNQQFNTRFKAGK